MKRDRVVVSSSNGSLTKYCVVYRTVRIIPVDTVKIASLASKDFTGWVYQNLKIWQCF